MSSFLERIKGLSQKQLAVLALRLNNDLEQARRSGNAPVAVVGIGCRLPGGVSGPDEYWQFLMEGREAISEVPRDRWDSDVWFDPDPDAPGQISVKLGGFLDDVAGFDAEHFGISPREAATMDPQQRLLLEVAWEALEHGGIDPSSLSGSATGVFVGVCNTDHFQRVLKRGSSLIDAYVASGNAPSVVAGRISYVLGLAGPALTVDTACSSSLVALHQAIMSLRARACDVALAGGVNVICEPDTMVSLSKAGMLAPDGRCKAFDEAADGFARGEGCGLVVLKRLDDALRDNDQIHAVIRGSALNHDGRSAGLTVPSRRAQVSVIQSALANAGIAPEEVGYVEAHGTGTRLGDPIEIRALSSALASARPVDRPLVVGSAKTNFGHLESAAGIAGTIKTILALKHGRIPQHLHFHRGNPEVDWDRSGIELAVTSRDWPAWAERRIAGVSSFGFSGTNAHVVLEAPPEATAEAIPERARCLPVSARTEAALMEQARRLSAGLAEGNAEFAAAATTLSTGRAHLPERLAVVARTSAEAAEVLECVAAGGTDDRALRGHVEPGESNGVVFLCTGQGVQYPGMARALFEESKAFREVIERCDAALGPQDGARHLIDMLHGTSGRPDDLHRTEWTQPALFAVECGLAALWRSWGVEPAALIGHSAGELAAACIAGVFTLEDGLKLAARRGQLLSRLPEGGAMAALFTGQADVERAIAPYAGRVSIAAVNAHDSVVISGATDGIEAVLNDLARAGLQGHRLQISFAAHSPLVEAALDDMARAAADVPVQSPTVPVAWNVTGGAPLPGGAPDPGYWQRHLREPVRFADGMSRLRADGHRVFLEIGPHPVLAALAARDTDALKQADRPVYLGSLRRDHDDWAEMSRALGGLFVNGVPVDWAATVGTPRPRPVALPSYPFEHRRFWIDPVDRTQAAVAPAPADRPIPGTRLDMPDPVFEADMSTVNLPWLAEHEVMGSALVAGPVYLALAVGAAEDALERADWEISDFEVAAPLRAGEERLRVQTRLSRNTDGSVEFTIHSRPSNGSDHVWVKHAKGRMIPGAVPTDRPGRDIPVEARRLNEEDSAPAHHDRLAALGINLVGRFRSLQRLHRNDGEVYARIGREDAANGIVTPFCDPGLLDGVFQAAGATLPPDAADAGKLYFLTSVERIALRGPLPAPIWCHARLRPGSDGTAHDVDVTVFDQEGREIGQLAGVRLTAQVQNTPDVPRHYGIDWHASPLHLPAARQLRPADAIREVLRDTYRQFASRHGLDLYDRLLPALDRLVRAQVCTALNRLGVNDLSRGWHEIAELADSLSIVPGQRMLFARLIDILVEGGGLEKKDGLVLLDRAMPDEDAAALHAATEREFGSTPELSILGRCGAALAEVLSGAADPLDCLFPGGSLAEARQLYVEAPFARTYNATLGTMLKELAKDVPDGEEFRILEIGAGTGGTSEAALAALEGRIGEYCFTDVSQHFLDAALQHFGDRKGFTTRLLDIEREPAAQGVATGQYDIVLAANVLHATRDLAQSVAHAVDLLAPGGVIVMLEGVRPDPWVDLTFGMTPGWWRFTDRDLRPDYPLISMPQWHELLDSVGLTGTLSVGGSDELGRGAAQQMLISARKPMAPSRRIAIIGGKGALGTTLEERLAAEGAVVVQPEDAPEEVIDLSVLELAEIDETAVDFEARIEETAVLAPLARLQELARDENGGRLWIATCGLQNVDAKGPAAAARWQSPVAGLGRVAALEVPNAWGGLVDLDPADPPVAQAAAIARSVLANDPEDQCAWRQGIRHIPRLVSRPAPDNEPIKLDPNGTYLITGGFGGIGGVLAGALAERGAGRVVLLGRNPDENGPGMTAVQAAGAEAVAMRVDVSDPAALADAFARLTQEGQPIRGAFHAAAHLDAAPLAELDQERVRAMLRPKINGTLALERLLARHGSDFLALFSSTTSVLGAQGFAHYAAANAFLDASASAVEQGLRVIPIGWGTWEVMRLASEEAQGTYGAQGLHPMRTDAALDALFGILGGDAGHRLVADIDWKRLVGLHETRRPRPMLSRLVREDTTESVPSGTRAEAKAGEDKAAALLARIATAPAAARIGILENVVASEAAAAMGRSNGDDVARNRGLFDMGMDSLMSVELRHRLEEATSLKLPSTLTFNYPTVSALASFIDSRLLSQPSSAVSAQAESVIPPTSAAPASDPNAADTDDEDDLIARLRARLEELR
jgi:acyl transferase domain-containing protein